MAPGRDCQDARHFADDIVAAVAGVRSSPGWTNEMGPALLHCLTFVALCTRGTLSDTSTYADRATELLVARAMARHIAQDSSVRDYTAKLRYRVSFGFAR